jgi:hypothetical protein
LVVFISSITTTLRADEGMWLPLFIERLNYTDMQKLGENIAWLLKKIK